MARTPVTNALIKKLVKEAMDAPRDPAAKGGEPGSGAEGSVKQQVAQLVNTVGEKLKAQFPPQDVEREMSDLHNQVTALIRASVAKLKSAAPKGEKKPVAA